MMSFIRTTMIGGVIFLIPFAVVILVIGKVVPIMRKIVEPLAAFIPFESVVGLKIPVLLTTVLLLITCFLAGLLARTRSASRLAGALESSLLGRIPGYDLLQSISADVAGQTEAAQRQVVLVQLDDGWQLGLRMEQIGGDRWVAVFIPDSPTPQTGAVLIVEAGRVRPANISVTELFACYRKRGLGIRRLLEDRK